MAKPRAFIDADRRANTPTNSPTAWFAVLERARLVDDYGLANRARRELERLGVIVRFRRARDRREGGDRE